MHALPTLSTGFCPSAEREVNAPTESREMTLEEWTKQLPCSHRARREYEDLICSARWGKTAKVLFIIGVLYNALVLALFFLSSI